MSKCLNISGKIDVYDVEKFQDWLFVALQEEDFVGTFDIRLDEEDEEE